MLPSSMASSSSLSSSKFDVFLSFRGEDTRKTFTDHLYEALYQRGIKTFIDEESLERGERIQERLWSAIEGSTICIPILSRSYGDSSWCMMELAKMVQCGNKIIIPVFYHVDPSDVRHQRGPFGEPFRRHQSRFDEETVGEWRRALREVAAFSGYDIRNVANGHEAKLILEIVTKVQKELHYKDFAINGNYNPAVRALCNQVNRMGDEIAIRMAEQLRSGGLLGTSNYTLGLQAMQEPLRQVQAQRPIQVAPKHPASSRDQPMQIHEQKLKQGEEKEISWNGSTRPRPYVGSGVHESFQELLKGQTVLFNSTPSSSCTDFCKVVGAQHQLDEQNQPLDQGPIQKPQDSSTRINSNMGQGLEVKHKLERQMQWDKLMGMAQQMNSGASTGSTHDTKPTVQAMTDQLNQMRVQNFIHMLEKARDIEDTVAKIVEKTIYGRMS